MSDWGTLVGQTTSDTLVGQTTSGTSVMYAHAPQGAMTYTAAALNAGKTP